MVKAHAIKSQRRPLIDIEQRALGARFDDKLLTMHLHYTCPTKVQEFWHFLRDYNEALSASSLSLFCCSVSPQFASQEYVHMCVICIHAKIHIHTYVYECSYVFFNIYIYMYKEIC